MSIKRIISLTKSIETKMKFFAGLILVMCFIDLGYSNFESAQVRRAANGAARRNRLNELRRRNIPCEHDFKVASTGCVGCAFRPGTYIWQNPEGVQKDIYQVMKPDECATGRTVTINPTACCCSGLL